MIRVEKFQMKHLKNFDCSAIVADLEISMAENDMHPKVDMVTLLNDDGDVICIAGINHLRIGVGEVWIIRSELINKYKLEFYKTIKGLVDYIFKFMGLHRIELAILSSWHGGAKWAHSLGFKFESVARAYDYQFNDHDIYTRIERGS